ncbi:MULTISPECIES: DNA polymerase III subunit gamma/tau [Acetobacterium]|jgi:DNA polymerase-3 subunit gamma/tau|uniref:DNA-directed DNA polymerase n=1 Tax=Acetobacterium wieringae TaxID=52694 RepID=A0A1F2PGT6_9FIRM|nr:MULTISPECIES: DNA polymerase III subunit gamma/tau [Acetobacterium]OFV69931.1 DNA polymerase III subunit tau [Acetobacterium wieringae]URN85317.1 DNA polymerase III subunit gamma/tau [Acetobacterium wieringae]
MSYLALYRKYRPQTFDEVVGQDSITKILRNQIKFNRVGHAYLFSGIRGTGKTSLAKIFAKAINCPNGIDGNPCNRCDVCLKIDRPGVMDIIEIDGASNRGVDEIREIRERIKYPPTVGKYKVYIIDEVHMLTKEAFNALLKTLEEPPEHAVFILATTEPNKCPVTILSRCQRYEIRPIPKALIIEQMKKICQDIQVTMSDESFDFIASRGENSMRDSLSLLDQIIDLKDEAGHVTVEDLLAFTGMAEKQAIGDLVKLILAHDSAGVLSNLRNLVDNGKDSILLMDQIIEFLRGVLITKTAKDTAKEILLCSPDDFIIYQQLGKELTFDRLYRMISLLIEEKNKLKYSNLQAIIVEMALLKICLGDQQTALIPAVETVFQNNEKKPLLQSRPHDRLEKTCRKSEIQAESLKRPAEYEIVKSEISKSAADVISVPAEKSETTNSADEGPEGESDKAPVHAKSDIKIKSGSSRHDGMLFFKMLCEEIGKTNSGQAMFLKRGEPTLEDETHLLIVYSPENRNFYQFVNKPELIKGFEMALLQKLGKEISITIKLEDENFNELDLVEKTLRIVNDQAVKIINADDEL